MQECCIAVRQEGFLLWASTLTGCPGVPWPRATTRLPSAVWTSKPLVTETAWRKRDWVDGAGRNGRPARRPKSTRLTVSTARRPAVDPHIDSKTRPKGAALLREPFRLDRASRRDAVTGAQWEERGEEDKATSAGRGEAAFAPGGDVRCAVVPGNDAWTRRAGAVEDCDRLLGKEAGRECGL